MWESDGHSLVVLLAAATIVLPVDMRRWAGAALAITGVGAEVTFDPKLEPLGKRRGRPNFQIVYIHYRTCVLLWTRLML